jgi:hypothetical protein
LSDWEWVKKYLRMDARREIEKPKVRVILASKISAEDRARFNLGCLDPAKVNVDEWRNRKSEKVLYVPKTGEILKT